MAFSRAAIVRNLRNFRARPTAARPQFNQVARRTYASGGHGEAKSGGDAVWAAGAVAVTVPSCWFLISNKPEPAHSHGGHGDSHAHEEHEEEKEEEVEEKEEDKPAESEEKTEEKTEDKEEPKESEKTEESDSDDEAKEQDTPATSDDEETVGETDKNVRKSIPDAKGGNKARSESKAAIKQGEDNSEAKEGEPSDKAAASKEPQSKNTQSGKQEGLSNTDTKHSTDITNDPSKSKKGEGAPETAKVKGTVDPNRPQPEEESDS
ncbi:hypothetical protein BCIN_03g07260 [Botrytis cinerea B05.10]|uniref:Cylicin I n=2 Tax=Botryotinia fuckeliana TaxID=40559 RepID=A0A384JD38_BOTFB|nr:hypothetical protein BCIN_03g07260 [Botrytis cinerea B05.10]XP_024547915.1 hypothetical protein BCIN_03g07260 [Botrytis cinerea B05.10]ATZ48524.1 hypothetical protein BCIN_03g07260 [Botrytis cinerea B05.10]ATZ48525.1 hypothetical protein BCIN_03g07260 [Botrytis cinerea B05.10]EMR82351.1 hypothetical protein BcDW1_9025 [Botrytis cinerea BcDW1]